MARQIEYRIQSTRTASVRGQDSGDEAWVPSSEAEEMACRWELIDDLLGGTDVMRARGERWLPREQAESPSAYKCRLSRSFLSNGFKDTIEKLVAKPFSRAVAVAPDSLGDPRLDEIQWDADRAGTEVTEQGRRLFTDMVTYGKCHLLVDYPSTDPGLSLAQERDSAVRPVLLRVHPRDVIGWRSERRGDGGEEVLTQVRIRECRLEDRGKYGTRRVTYVRVINAPPESADSPAPERTAAETAAVAGTAAGQAVAAPGSAPQGSWELFKQGENGGWALDSEGRHSFPGVPLCTAYAERQEFMQSRPPMQDLAELQLCHWQSYSDQRNILKYVRMAMLSKTGISQEEYDKPSVIAPNEVLKSINPDARFGYVEHSGAGVEAGRNDLKDIEERMETLGMQPLVASTATSTATGKAMDENKNDTTIQSWIRSLEALLEEAYGMAATWLGKELPDDFSVDVFNDFGVDGARAGEGDLLLRARAQGDLTRLTMLREMKRRGILSDGVDVDAENDELGTEEPLMTGGPFGRGGFGKGPGDPADPEAKDKGEGDGSDKQDGPDDGGKPGGGGNPFAKP